MGQDQVSKFWRDLINRPDLVDTERAWAQYIRIKYDALIEVGFKDDQALKVVIATVKNIINNVVFKGEIQND